MRHALLLALLPAAVMARRPTTAAVLAYCGGLVCANITIAHLGPAASPFVAFLFIGLDLSLRDYLHDQWRGRALWPRMLGLIGAAGAASYAIDSSAGMIAIASVAAFAAGAIADAIVYHAMRNRAYLSRSNGSNCAGAVVDSILFPTLAFGVFMPEIIALQTAAKIGGGFLWSLVIAKARSVEA